MGVDNKTFKKHRREWNETPGGRPRRQLANIIEAATAVRAAENKAVRLGGLERDPDERESQ